MAANRQQGSYLAAFLVGFTAFPAGLVTLSSNSVLGGVIALGGLGALTYSLLGFYRIKPMEFMND